MSREAAGSTEAVVGAGRAERPVLYLDIDGVLWDVDQTSPAGIGYGARGARGIGIFVKFALEHFEVRWCTMWAPSGTLHMEGRETLAQHTGIPASTWARVRSSKGHVRFKHETIDHAEHLAGRPFVWVEDGLLPEEHQWLRGNGWQDRYFHTDVFADPDALVKTTLHALPSGTCPEEGQVKSTRHRSSSAPPQAGVP